MDVEEQAAPMGTEEAVMPSKEAESAELWESPLGQSTYLFMWAIASLASFAIFFKYF
tara:strand:- start:8521 stop:8691 length:171 start_codon:yes stop_codon:yes gene_type:complete